MNKSVSVLHKYSSSSFFSIRFRSLATIRELVRAIESLVSFHGARTGTSPKERSIRRNEGLDLLTLESRRCELETLSIDADGTVDDLRRRLVTVRLSVIGRIVSFAGCARRDFQVRASRDATRVLSF